MIMEDKNVTFKIDGLFWGLTALFVAMKLEGTLNWSWLMVLFPIWLALPFALVVHILCIVDAIFLKRLFKRTKPTFAKGNRLVWDAKTGEIYGDTEKEIEE